MNVEVIGTIATIITLLYTVLGLPAQIRKNKQRGSVEGISLFMCIMLLLTFSSWVVYAVFKKDYYILISNLPGAICALVILFQLRLYKN
ncbi:MAG: hypothetical protein JWN50_153 [Parcubacteria group bacterium]|nr:hypothetical protein [Parcubacteria group bacterium]